MEPEKKIDTYGAGIGICVILVALSIGGISIFNKKLKEYGETQRQVKTATTTTTQETQDDLTLDPMVDVTSDVDAGL